MAEGLGVCACPWTRDFYDANLQTTRHRLYTLAEAVAGEDGCGGAAAAAEDNVHGYCAYGDNSVKRLH